MKEYHQQLASNINKHQERGILLLVLGLVFSLASILTTTCIGLSSMALIIGDTGKQRPMSKAENQEELTRRTIKQKQAPPNRKYL